VRAAGVGIARNEGRSCKMMKSTLLLGFVGLSALALTVVTTDANAQEKVRWKMQSAFGSQLPHLGTSGVRFAKNVERL
jgi:TRAP-type mannitol/chloroaromatic compound transport system substrate-binding protein